MGIILGVEAAVCIAEGLECCQDEGAEWLAEGESE